MTSRFFGRLLWAVVAERWTYVVSLVTLVLIPVNVFLATADADPGMSLLCTGLVSVVVVPTALEVIDRRAQVLRLKQQETRDRWFP